MLDGRRQAFARRPNVLESHQDGGPDTEEEGEVIRVQSRGALGRIPTPTPPLMGINPETGETTPGSPADALRRFFGLAGRYAGRTVRMREFQREDLPESEKSGGKTELIPPHVDDEPFRGADPTKPALDPKLTQPAPYPSDPPLKLPDREAIIPPRRDPRDYIEIHPDPSDWIARLPIIVENRQGTPATKDLNRKLGIPTLENGREVFGVGGFTQIGGPMPNASARYSEQFDRFRDKEAFGFKSNAASSFEDVTYLIDYQGVQVKFIISTVTEDKGVPKPEERRGLAKLVMNVKEHAIIVDVPKLSEGEAVDHRAWDEYVRSRLLLIKDLIDRKVITQKGFNQKVFDSFGPHPKR